MEVSSWLALPPFLCCWLQSLAKGGVGAPSQGAGSASPLPAPASLPLTLLPLSLPPSRPALQILPDSKEVVACFPDDASGQGFPEACFKVSYDLLVLGVGCVNNTFGIQGVAEHTNFFKSVEDASRLRLRVSECFERAALPATTAEERRKLLSFVIVGGGPTGVEVAAELHDLITEDLATLYPDQVGDFCIRIVELTSDLLSTYDRAISAYTATTFRRNGIDLVLNSRVQSVGDGSVSVVGTDNTVSGGARGLGGRLAARRAGLRVVALRLSVDSHALNHHPAPLARR